MTGLLEHALFGFNVFTLGYFVVTGTLVVILLVMVARRFGRDE